MNNLSLKLKINDLAASTITNNNGEQSTILNGKCAWQSSGKNQNVAQICQFKSSNPNAVQTLLDAGKNGVHLINGSINQYKQKNSLNPEIVLTINGAIFIKKIAPTQNEQPPVIEAQTTQSEEEPQF